MAYDFKKEEDVKEYLENLGIEYRFQCYEERDPDGCCRLGEYFEAIKRDFKNAAQVFKLNCEDSNHGRSCYKFGNYSYLGKGCEKDTDTALKSYKKGCENNFPEACFQAGLLLYAVDQKYKDYKNGLKYFEMGCNLKEPESCYFASSAYISGEHIEKDMKKAFDYSVKACAMNNIYACANLSHMYRTGVGVEKNETQAEIYKAKALDIREQLMSAKTSVEFGRTS